MQQYTFPSAINSRLEQEGFSMHSGAQRLMRNIHFPGVAFKLVASKAELAACSGVYLVSTDDAYSHGFVGPYFRKWLADGVLYLPSAARPTTWDKSAAYYMWQKRAEIRRKADHSGSGIGAYTYKYKQCMVHSRRTNEFLPDKQWLCVGIIADAAVGAFRRPGTNLHNDWSGAETYPPGERDKVARAYLQSLLPVADVRKLLWDLRAVIFDVDSKAFDIRDQAIMEYAQANTQPVIVKLPLTTFWDYDGNISVGIPRFTGEYGHHGNDIVETVSLGNEYTVNAGDDDQLKFNDETMGGRFDSSRAGLRAILPAGGNPFGMVGWVVTPLTGEKWVRDVAAGHRLLEAFTQTGENKGKVVMGAGTLTDALVASIDAGVPPSKTGAGEKFADGLAKGEEGGAILPTSSAGLKNENNATAIWTASDIMEGIRPLADAVDIVLTRMEQLA